MGTSKQPQIDRPGYKRVERTGWRDQELSERHGTWGFNCPAVDIDFLMIEYDHGQPAALIEYKHHRALRNGGINLRASSYRALREMAERSKVPFLIAYYHPETWAFMAVPVNRRAVKFFPAGRRNVWITEREFVATLYRIRAYVAESRILEGLSTALPE